MSAALAQVKEVDKIAMPAVPRTALIHKKINKTPVNTDSINALTHETDRMVTGTFVNVETPGQPAYIGCRYYKNQEFFTQVLKDGEKYTVPLSVARHINEQCRKEEHSYLQDEKGNPLKTGKFTNRYRFIAEF